MVTTLTSCCRTADVLALLVLLLHCTGLLLFVLDAARVLAVVVVVGVGVVAASVAGVRDTCQQMPLLHLVSFKPSRRHGPRRSTCVQVFCGVQKWRDPRGVITKRNWILTESALSLLSVVVRSITSKPVTLGSRSRDF